MLDCATLYCPFKDDLAILDLYLDVAGVNCRMDDKAIAYLFTDALVRPLIPLWTTPSVRPPPFIPAFPVKGAIVSEARAVAVKRKVGLLSPPIITSGGTIAIVRGAIPIPHVRRR